LDFLNTDSTVNNVDQLTTLGKLTAVHTQVPLSPSSIIVLTKGLRRSGVAPFNVLSLLEREMSIPPCLWSGGAWHSVPIKG